MAPNYTLTLIQFEKEYKNKNIFMFNFESFGYSTLHEVFASLSHLVEIKETSTSTKDCEYYTVTLINVRDVDSGNGKSKYMGIFIYFKSIYIIFLQVAKYAILLKWRLLIILKKL